MKQLHLKEKQDLIKILAQNGENRSQDLVNILDTFLALENHQTAADIMRRLKSRGMDYDLEFIQEALDLFCRYGFAQTKCFNGHMTLYEHRHLGQHHDHLICTRCGRVEEFINPIIEELQSAAARHKGFVPLDHRMEIYGLCQDCAMSRGRAVPLSEAEKGEHMVVCGHIGGEELQRRLTDMGLCSGAEIEVLGSGSGPVVVACRGSRLALGQGMCDKVMVTPAEKPEKPSRRFRWRGFRRKRPCGQ